MDRVRPGTTHADGRGTDRQGSTGLRSTCHTAATGVNSSPPPGINKESLMTWYKQGITDGLV